MLLHPARSAALALSIVAGAAALASCTSPDHPITGASANTTALASRNTVSMCHRSGSAAGIIEVARADVSLHRDHGDYLTHLYVSNDPDQPTDAAHFHMISEALAAARAGRLARGETQRAACRITIDVAPGVFPLSGDPAGTDPLKDHLPFLVDVPDLTIHGAFVMGLDGDGRATGEGVGSVATTLAMSEQLEGDETTGDAIRVFVINGHPKGSAGNGLTVEGFIFQAGDVEGARRQAILSLRVRDLRVTGNRFEGGFIGAIDLRASSAVINANYLTSGACALCLAGPGSYTVTANRIVGGGEDAIFVNGMILIPPPVDVEPYDPPKLASTFADIGNNDVRNYQNPPVGAGIRLGSFGPNGSGVETTIHGRIHDNLVVDNEFGMIFEAGFPDEGSPLKGDMDVVLGNDVFSGNCEANVYIAFARHVTGLLADGGQYLRKTTRRLDLGNDIRFEDLWYANPPGLGNKLFVNGRRIANGIRTFYSDGSCPNLGT